MCRIRERFLSPRGLGRRRQLAPRCDAAPPRCVPARRRLYAPPRLLHAACAGEIGPRRTQARKHRRRAARWLHQAVRPRAALRSLRSPVRLGGTRRRRWRPRRTAPGRCSSTTVRSTRRRTTTCASPPRRSHTPSHKCVASLHSARSDVAQEWEAQATYLNPKDYMPLVRHLNVGSCFFAHTELRLPLQSLPLIPCRRAEITPSQT